MSRFVLCACCALVGAPCLADPIVIEGHHDYLELREDRQWILPAGASVKRLYMDSQADLTVDGGTITERVTILSDMLEFKSSGSASVPISRRDPLVQLVYHVRDYRIDGPTDTRFQGFTVFAWMADGSFLRTGVGQSWDINWPLVQPVFVMYDGPTDPTGDGRVTIDDLNAVRNQFGSAGPADWDQSGVVDVADLNFVRNHFGLGYPESLPVPEPSAWALLIGAGAVVGAGYGVQRIRHRPIPGNVLLPWV